MRPVLFILVYYFNSNAGHLFYVGFVLSAYFNSYFSIHMVNRKRMSICKSFIWQEHGHESKIASDILKGRLFVPRKGLLLREKD